MMLSNSQVQCADCKRSVNKLDTFASSNPSRELRYRCRFCYSVNRDLGLGQVEKPQVKREYFCGRCKYKFKSLGTLCPYCSKQDQVVEQVHSVMDLL
ncbi:MAG: hypothetical protein Q8R47_06345 [Nanoarchaeota archaeon]|nr:hypothetical protein [Nanoarchaeota archaeon]